MKLSPALMNSALILHNNIIRKAKFQVRALAASHCHAIHASIYPRPCMVTRKLHNTLFVVCVRAPQSFGFTVEQEGDSYSIIFLEAVDAVKFCLQVRK